MRSSYLGCYDIADDKRLRKVSNIMCGFGDHLHFSILECEWTAADLVRRREALRQIIPHTQNQEIRCSFTASAWPRAAAIASSPVPASRASAWTGPCIVV